MKYRRKPETVVGIQVAHGNMAKIEALLGAKSVKRGKPIEKPETASDTLAEPGPWLSLIIGQLTAKHGDFIVVDAQGDLQVLSPVAFAAAYDPD